MRRSTDPLDREFLLASGFEPVPGAPAEWLQNEWLVYQPVFTDTDLPAEWRLRKSDLRLSDSLSPKTCRQLAALLNLLQEIAG